jgi:4,5-DOPA dioxygenase extradiol
MWRFVVSQNTNVKNILSDRMPILFVGHGSPMNAIEKNSYTFMLESLAQKIKKPKVILMISAHWMSEGTWVLGMDKPKTIHDFYGFPQELFDIQYSAPGSPETAKFIESSIIDPRINNDLELWGFDHGTWSVLRHMYPAADVPVLQMSLNMARSPEYHFNIGQQLSKLRDQDVLIIGSGNLVHNLRRIDWNTHAKPHDWAVEFDAWLKIKLDARDFAALIKDYHKTEAGKLSIPTMDHYLPLHYILGATTSKDELHFEFEELHNASISMRTFGFWPS